MSGAKVAVAYNIDFDWHFISKALEENGFDFENDTPELRCCMKKFSEIYGEWDSERLRYRWQYSVERSGSWFTCRYFHVQRCLEQNE